MVVIVVIIIIIFIIIIIIVIYYLPRINYSYTSYPGVQLMFYVCR